MPSGWNLPCRCVALSLTSHTAHLLFPVQISSAFPAHMLHQSWKHLLLGFQAHTPEPAPAALLFQLSLQKVQHFPGLHPHPVLPINLYSIGFPYFSTHQRVSPEALYRWKYLFSKVHNLLPLTLQDVLPPTVSLPWEVLSLYPYKLSDFGSRFQHLSHGFLLLWQDYPQSAPCHCSQHKQHLHL